MLVTISFSSMEKFKECPKKYFLHYIRKLRQVKMGSALIFGSAIDAALNDLLVERNIDAAKSIFIQNFTKFKFAGDDKPSLVMGNDKVIFSARDNETFFIKEPDRKFLTGNHQNDSWFSLKHKGLLMLETYFTDILPHIDTVISTQKEVQLINEENNTLQGFIDFIAVWKYNPNVNSSLPPDLCEHDGKTIFFDNKTSSKSYATNSISNSAQLAIYSIFVNEPYGTSTAGYIVLDKRVRRMKLPPIKTQVIIGEIPSELVDRTFSDCNNILDKIKNGDFPRRTENCKGIYGKCVYYEYCHNNDTTDLIDLKKDIDK
jgi:hypothetical protein